MRLAFTSDIHIDLNGPATLDALAAHLRGLSADVVLIAGDIATGATTWLKTLLALKETAPNVLVVSGNHDVWSSPDAQAKGINAWTWLDTLLPALCTEAGVTLLDAGPIALGNTGFAGSLAWYDLSMREHLLGAPMEAYRSGEWSGMRWNDHRFALFPDDAGKAMLPEAVCARLQERLGVHLRTLQTPRIVVATHTLAFAEQIFVKQHPGWRFANAFMGSLRTGELLRADPRVILAIAGHTHIPSEHRFGGLRAIVSPLGYQREWRSPDVRAAVTKAVTVVDLPGS
jgi:hypothetical protein